MGRHLYLSRMPRAACPSPLPAGALRVIIFPDSEQDGTFMPMTPTARSPLGNPPFQLLTHVCSLSGVKGVLGDAIFYRGKRPPPLTPEDLFKTTRAGLNSEV